MTQAVRELEPTRILLVDLSHLYWSAYHATKDQAQHAAAESTLHRAHQLREGYEFVAFCCDSPPYKRKQVFEGYKANREPAPPAAHDQFDRVKDRLRRDGLLLWAAPGYEADDIIATAVKRALELDEPVRITIASNDKDLLQLVRDPVVHYLSTNTGIFMMEREVFAKFGVLPQQIGDLLALMGDKSDGIEGIPGVGPKTAAQWLVKHKTLDGVLEAAPKEKVGAVQDNIVKHGDKARLARKLVELDTTAPLNFDEIFEERKPEPLVEMDMAALDATEDDDQDLAELIPGPKAEPPPTFAGELVSPPATKRDAKQPGPEPATVQTPTNGAGGSGGAIVPSNMPFEMQLQPGSLKAAHALGTAIFNSRLFAKFPNAEAVTAVILRGREMGLTALTSCQAFHFFDGQLVMHAHLIAAKIAEHHDCEYFRFVGGDDTYAEYECKHRAHPEPTRLRYTIEQAKQAGLCPPVLRTENPTPGEKDRRGNWEKRPAEMLRKTCAVQLGRLVFPSAAMGLYSAIELGGDE
jgi:5'-3' exonuclease